MGARRLFGPGRVAAGHIYWTSMGEPKMRKYKKPLTEELIKTAIAERDFELQAIRAVTEGIERNCLLVIATGTGKTRTCIALIDASMRVSNQNE